MTASGDYGFAALTEPVCAQENRGGDLERMEWLGKDHYSVAAICAVYCFALAPPNAGRPLHATHLFLLVSTLDRHLCLHYMLLIIPYPIPPPSWTICVSTEQR